MPQSNYGARAISVVGHLNVLAKEISLQPASGRRSDEELEAAHPLLISTKPKGAAEFG